MFCAMPPFSRSSSKTKSTSLNQFLTWLDGVFFLPYVLQHTSRLSWQAAISPKHERPLPRRGVLWYAITEAETLITSVYRSNLLCKDLLKHNPNCEQNLQEALIGVSGKFLNYMYIHQNTTSNRANIQLSSFILGWFTEQFVHYHRH